MRNNSYIIPDKTNLGLFSLVTATSVFQFFILPVFLLPQNLMWGWWIIPLVPFNNMMWFLIHESIHKNLHSNGKINKFTGRVLAIMFGSSFHVLAFGHLMHHKLNRHWESEITAEKPGFAGKLKYYSKLTFGVYFTEVMGSLIMFMLNKRQIMQIARQHKIDSEVESYFYRKDRMPELNTEMALSLLFFTASAICFGPYWPIFVAIIALRAISISLMDNIFHYDTPEDNSVPGKQVRTNRLVSFFILNGNYHGTHHSNPKVPWKYLPHEASERGIPQSESFSSALASQFKGPRLIAN